MRNYSSEFKEAAVVKLCRPGGPTVSALAAELGITTKSHYRPFITATDRSLSI